MENSKEPLKKIRPASTIILVREHQRELQVYLLRRSTGSGFFPGNYVFPGGTLDPDDYQGEFWLPQIDLSAQALDRKFGPGLDLEGIIAYGVAAIRETFEEAGVFLARKKVGSTESLSRCGRLRSQGALKGSWFRKWVSEEDWVLSFSSLFPWSHWITPEAMPKRFDTRFFVACMPEGQECIPDNQETVHGIWINPRKGLLRNMEGEIPLSPPTVITLHDLLEFERLADLQQTLPARTWGDPLRPFFIKLEKGGLIIEPWDPQFGKKIEIDPAGLKEKVVPVGEPFSRIWLNQGLWRPIRA